jgi:hypothetical protein
MAGEPMFESLLDALLADADLREAPTSDDLERLRKMLAAETLPSREELLAALLQGDR